MHDDDLVNFMFGNNNKANSVAVLLAGIQKDITALDLKVTGLSDHLTILQSSVFTDTDSISKKIMEYSTKSERISDDIEHLKHKTSDHETFVYALKDSVGGNARAIEFLANAAKEQAADRKTFYYALVVPVIIALIPSVALLFNPSRNNSMDDIRTFNNSFPQQPQIQQQPSRRPTSSS